MSSSPSIPPTIDRIESGISPAAAVGDESSVRSLGYAVSGYVAIFHLIGTSLLLRARGILKTKAIDVFLFCLSATVSSFANGGSIASNENMAIINKDPVVLLLMIAQVLGSNTLFPLFLRWVIRALKKLTRRDEFKCMLKSTVGAQLSPLLPKSQTSMLSLTVIGLMTALLVLFCAVDWNGAVFDGLNSVERLVSALFVAVNFRHAGENSIDCCLISPAVLVFVIVMM